MAQRDPSTAHGQKSSRAGRLSHYSNVMCRRGANDLADVHLIMPDVHRGNLQRNNANRATLFPKEPNGSCSFPCSGRTTPIRIPTTTRPARGQFVNLTSPRTEQWSGARSSSLPGRQETVISMSLYHLLRATRCAHLHACASSRRASARPLPVCAYAEGRRS